jgi:hypothetical protein
VLALKRVGSVLKRRCETLRRDLRVLAQNLRLRCPARRELEQEFDTQTRPAEAGFATENLRIGNDQTFSH